MNNRDHRRAPRKPIDTVAVAIDSIAERPLGQLCNVSASGILLIGEHKPRSGGIYQARMKLPSTGGEIEVGLQEQWHDPAARPGQYWVGYRIIAISENHGKQLERWLLS